MAALRATDGLIGRFLLLWAGIALGVAFLATPAKFMAPSLSLPVALDVGRHTFAAFNRLELLLLAGLLLLDLRAAARRRWLLALAIPGAVVLLQAVWLIPALDARVGEILAGHPAGARSGLHAVYIAAEAVKVGALLFFGFRKFEART